MAPESRAKLRFI